MTKKKLLFTAIAALITLCVAVGGGTYALFTSSAKSASDSFASGTLKLSTHRHDVPVEGPMFYTDDNNGGRMGTGLWAPGDVRTRAMLIKNTGTLDAKLNRLAALPEGDESERRDALAFGRQAMVTVAALATSDGQPLDAAEIERVNAAFDEEFKRLLRSPLFPIARIQQEAAAFLREAFLSWTYEFPRRGRQVGVKVADLYAGKLDDLYNSGNGVAAPLPSLVLKAGETLHLGYTVTFLNDEGQAFRNNDLQGKEVRFTFRNDFQQARNNP